MFKKIFLFLIFIIFFSIAYAAAFPQRIISGMPSITEMLYALGLENRIVGVTTNCNYPPEARKKEKIGGFFLNLEKVVSLKPDLIVMLEDAQKRDIAKFKDYGLPVYTINPHTVEEVMDALLKLGEITGEKKRAERIVARMRGRLATVKKKKNRPKVLVIVGYNPIIVAGRNTFIDDIIKHAGGVNVVGQAKVAYPHYSFEDLLRENPEYIIIPAGVVKLKEMLEDSRWRSLNAIRGNKILFIDGDVFFRPGPRIVEAIEEIACFLR